MRARRKAKQARRKQRRTRTPAGTARKRGAAGAAPRASARLAAYRRKRDFRQTPEPPPGARRESGRRLKYLVHLHHAAHRHFDLRLQVGGSLRSWAVPKGPSLDPASKRLAVQVEDHPLAYGEFEGSIPEGHYGAGRVWIWDEGHWQPEGDAAQALRKGRLDFELSGQRLKGGWSLIRTQLRGSKPNWLLIKRRDAEVQPGDVADDTPLSEWRGEGAAKKRARHPASAARPSASPDRRGDEKAVVLTNPDRQLFSKPPITKQELADFYREIADWLLPELVHRPISLVRCPNGIAQGCFFQKHASPGFHAAIKQVPITEKSGRRNYLHVEDIEGVVALVQMGVIELHAWGTRVDDIEHADRLVIDLDPGEGVSWPAVIEAAYAVRERLQKLGLQSFVRTSGGKGLHVLAPLRPAAPWPAVKAFTHAVALALQQERPQRYLAHAAKQRRRGLIYVDYLRNTRGATSVVSYCLRARDGAPAAVPLTWDELARLKSPSQFGYANLRRRLGELKEDPWAGLRGLRQTLPAKLSKG